MLRTAKPLMPFPRPMGSPWWWGLQGMCEHRSRKEVCACVVSRKEVCECVYPQERGVCVCIPRKEVYVCVCIPRKGVCVCGYPQERGVCVPGALGLLQPGALSGLSRPEAVQPASRMAGGIPGPEAPRAGPAGAGRTGWGRLADSLHHLVLSISPQAPRSQRALVAGSLLEKLLILFLRGGGSGCPGSGCSGQDCRELGRSGGARDSS